MIKKVIKKALEEPARFLGALNALVVLVVSFGLPLTVEMSNAITVIATALIGIWAAVSTRPIVPAAIATLIGTVLTALGAFGLHLSDDKIGALVAAVSVTGGFVLRLFVSPSPALKARVRAREPLAAAEVT